MSEFSKLLSQYMEKKDIQTYRLAQYCGYDRGNMYKIIKGKRNPPSKDFVERIAEYMHLSPPEKASLYEAYQISIIGYDHYYRRKAVMEFLTEVSRVGNLISAMPSMDIKLRPGMLEKNLMFLRGKHDIRSVLLYMIAEETCLKNGYIRLLLQPETDFWISILAMCDNTKFRTKIDHIFCLDDTKGEPSKGKNYNLACLKNILPVYNYNYEYHAWYYYGYIPTQNGMFALFPYMVLTSQYACVLTADMQKGYLTDNPEMIKMLSLIFEDCRSYASCFAQLSEEVVDQIKFLKTTFSERISGYCFQMTPCLMPVLTLEMIEKYVKRELPGRADFLEQLWEYIGELASQDLIYICSIEGIFKFLEDGEITEIPAGLYDLPEMSDRVEVVRRMFRTKHAEKLRILRRNIGNLDAQVYMYVTPERGTLRLSVSSNQIVNLWIQESGLVYAFFDFCEHLDSKWFYTLEEAQKLVEQKVQDIKERYEKSESEE